jgi:hypothetical protein
MREQDGKMKKEERIEKSANVSRRLLIFVGLTLVVTIATFCATLFWDRRFFISWFYFQCGAIGGFVSIKQRLKNMKDEELILLEQHWTAILVVPIFGGIFSLVLYLVFLSGTLEGHFFPKFASPSFHILPTTEDMKNFFTETYPKSGPDFALAAFWSFAAGFSERLVPQIIEAITSRGEEEI